MNQHQENDTFVHSETVSGETFECCNQKLMHILQHSYTLGWKEPATYITKVRGKEGDMSLKQFFQTIIFNLYHHENLPGNSPSQSQQQHLLFRVTQDHLTLLFFVSEINVMK